MPGVPASGGGFSPGQSQVSTQDQEKVGAFYSFLYICISQIIQAWISK